MHRLLLAALAISTALTAPAYAQSYKLLDTTAEKALGKAPVSVQITGTRTGRSYVTMYVGVNTDTAVPGVDYMLVSKSFEVLPTDTKITLDVPLLNTAGPGVTKVVTTKLVINRGGSLLRGTGKLTLLDTDVAPKPPVTCWNGTVVIPPAECPVKPPEPVRCPDGSSVIPPATCPVIPPPPPPPGPVVDNLVAFAGDSLNVLHSGNFGGTYCAARPTITCKGLAVGGTTLVTQQSQFDAALALRPEAFVILPGANDLGELTRYPTTAAWVNYLFSKTDKLRAAGIKVVVGTPAPQLNNPNHNARVPEARALILHAVGVKVDAAFDTSEPGGPLWLPSSFLPNDNVHFTYSCGFDCGGQGILATRARPEIDKVLGITPPPPPPPPPPVTGATARAVTACRAEYLAPTLPQPPLFSIERELHPSIYYSLVLNAIYPVIAKGLGMSGPITAVELPNGIQTYFANTCLALQ